MGMHDETYSNGQRTKHLEGDMLTYFFENGEVKAKGKCVEDKMDGKWLFYKKEGYLWQEGYFRLDTKHGAWIRYKSDGSVESQVEFENGNKKL